jgi:hypothetical protein
LGSNEPFPTTGVRVCNQGDVTGTRVDRTALLRQERVKPMGRRERFSDYVSVVMSFGWSLSGVGKAAEPW